MKIYNTMTRKKEEFVPLKKGSVGIYTCGPTVYWYAHVGNLRSYVFADVLKRVLMYNGFKVKHILNVTDVGHLTSDSDSGEDKLEAAATKEGKGAQDVARHYFEAFKKDFFKLNLIEPFKWPKATEHISEQIDLIKVLEKKGFTYKTSDGVYFDTSKFKAYGKLSRRNLEGLEAGKRIAIGEKKKKTDFALWKFSGEKGVRQQEWKSPWGLGFPGWHIECSAMATKYLGKQFDIHTGGEDLAMVHHENELAQSESALGKGPWVKYWMHGAFLNLPGGKMSKSSGKIKTISQLDEEGTDPLAYRYFTYSAHYRKPLTWSEEALETSVNGYKRLKNIIGSLKNERGVNKKYLNEFEARINDDLDMPGALAVLWKMLRDVSAKGKLATIKKMDNVFGLKLLEKSGVDIPSDIRRLADERLKARKKNDWKTSDKLRDKISKKGWAIKDIQDSYVLEKI